MHHCRSEESPRGKADATSGKEKKTLISFFSEEQQEFRRRLQVRMATNKAVIRAYASFQSRFQVLQRELVSCCEPVAKLFPRLIAGSRSGSNTDLIQAPSYSDLVLLGKLQLQSDCDHTSTNPINHVEALLLSRWSPNKVCETRGHPEVSTP